VAVGLLLIICIPHVYCLIYSRAQLNIWWVCWEDSHSTTARILGAVVEFTVGYVVIIVVFVLNLVLDSYLYTSLFFQGPLSQPQFFSLFCLLIDLSVFTKALYHCSLSSVILILFVIIQGPLSDLSWFSLFFCL